MPTDVIFCGICTIVEPLGHGRTPVTEAKCDEECCGEGHAAHEYARNYIHESAEEAAILILVEKKTDSVDLSCRYNEHDNSDKNSKIAVSLTSPVHHKLTISLPPLTGGKQQTVTLNKQLFSCYLCNKRGSIYACKDCIMSKDSKYWF